MLLLFFHLFFQITIGEYFVPMQKKLNLIAAEADFVIVKKMSGLWSLFVLICCTVRFDLSYFALPLILWVMSQELWAEYVKTPPFLFQNSECVHF